MDRSGWDVGGRGRGVMDTSPRQFGLLQAWLVVRGRWGVERPEGEGHFLWDLFSCCTPSKNTFPSALLSWPTPTYPTRPGSRTTSSRKTSLITPPPSL